MVREGPDLLEMQGALCIVLSIVMEKDMHTCTRTRKDITHLSKCLCKSTGKKKNPVRDGTNR